MGNGKGVNATHRELQKGATCTIRGGGELSWEGGEGKSRGEGGRERLLAFQTSGLRGDLTKDRRRAADLLLSLTRAARGGGELFL